MPSERIILAGLAMRRGIRTPMPVRTMKPTFVRAKHKRTDD